MTEAGNIEPSGRDIRCDQKRHLAILELLQCFQTRGLAHVAMQCNSVEPMPRQRPDQHPDVTLAVAENYRIIYMFIAQQAAQRISLALHVGPGEMLRHCIGCACRRCNLDYLWVADKFSTDLVNILG